MNLDFNKYSYPSRRNTVFGHKGMAATSNPQAAQAGIEMLKKGGNAIDAIVAMAMCLPVVEPTANGIGGDAFALVYTKGKLHGLNASGWSSKNISIKALKDKGIEAIRDTEIESVNVPGAPSAWAELINKFGKLTLKEVAQPAITYAEEGFPVVVNVANGWNRAYKSFYAKKDEKGHEQWYNTFSKDGRAPQAGEMWKYNHMGKTLRDIAETDAKSFYQGDLMEKIVKYSESIDGYFEKSDFTEYAPEWVEPISVNYKGYDVYEIPPNGSGITALMALNIFEKFEIDNTRETVRNYHLQMEAMKLAYADAHKYVAEPKYMNVSVEELLSKEYAAVRAKEICEMEAKLFTHGQPNASGTVYLCAADSEGNMVSYIQSNYKGFGSSLVVPGTDISLHNRGHNFVLEENHANALAPRKKPYHTIIPGFLMKDGKPVGPFGVMGGFMQPQGHMQMVINTVDFGMNPQDSLDATRWQWMKDKKITMESSVNEGIIKKLSAMGHDISMLYDYSSMGRGQIIWRDNESGVLSGGTEMRTDGMVAVW